MAKRTGVWLTGLVLATALVAISLVGLSDVSAYKADFSHRKVIQAQTAETAAVPTDQVTDKLVGRKIVVGPEDDQKSNLVRLANGYLIDTDQGEPKLPSDLKYDTPKGDEPAYYIVQFNGPVQESWRKGLEKAGAEVMFYLPDYAFVVRMNETVHKAIRSTKSEVKWTGMFQPAYKISPSLAARAKDGKVRASIILFSPEDMGKAVQQIEAVAGRKIFYKSSFEWEPGKFNKKVFVDVTLDQLTALANLPGVSWIEPMPEMKILNANTQVTMQNGVLTANARPMWTKGISGEGQLIQNLDTGCAEANEYFRDNTNRKSTWYWDNTHRRVVGQQPGARADEIELGWTEGTMSKFGDESANSYHGTHTAGSNCGNDSTILTGTYDGMAKNAKLVFIDGGGDSGSVFGTWDLNRVGSWGWDSAYKYLGQRAYISSNSWGSDDSGKYSGSSMEADQFMWSHKDYLWVFANGNTGTSAQPASKAGSPATCKNGVAVGALASAGASGLGGANTKATFSSWGRLTDGRLSPTVCAPGVGIISADGDGAGTRTMDGTSMACPIVAGATAMLRQYFTEGWYPTGTKIAADGFTPSAALMKATLMICGDSTTSWAGSFVPDSLFGWGRVNLDTSLFFSGNGVKLLLNDNRTGVNTGEAVEYLLTIPASASGLKISLTWTDYPGATFAAKTLVNDLDLDAYDPSAARYRGNRYGTTVPRQSVTTATSNDNIDIAEGIKVVAPAAGTWRIRVTGKNVAMGPQPFALVVTYKTAVATYPAMGKVYLDKNTYDTPIAGGVGDTLRIEIVDPNNTLASNNVSVYAKMVETTPEVVSCVKVGDGLFRGKIALYNGNPVNGDGRLSVDYLDSVRVVYVDANPAGADTAYAAIDGGTFTISNVRAADTNPPVGTMKNILWNTSKNTTSRVYYGLTTALGSTAGVDTPLVTDHSFMLSGLMANQIYFYDVESKDANGNTIRDDNAGRHYMFSTGGGSGLNDILIWMWDDNGYANSFIHADYLTYALRQGGWSYDWWSSQLQGDLSSTKLKTYKAVFIQVAQDGPQGGTYPAFTPAQRETLKKYHDAGARFAVTGNDIGWDTYKNQAAGTDLRDDTIFCRNYLHFTYKGDVTVENSALTVYGVASDPISGAYTAGISHTSWRTGACGDSVINSHYLPGYTGAPGTGSAVWDFPNAFDTCGVKWQSTNPMGTLGNGVWGGYQTRTVFNAFEITQLEASNPTSANRTDILNKMFVWLIGHDHPYDTIQTPVAGQTYTTNTIPIAWRSYAKGGATIDTTWVEYSNNEGASWNLLQKSTTAVSPYNWDVSSLENGTKYQVRVRVIDKGLYPAMSGFDTVGNFTINRTGGDYTGPVIMPGTIRFARNPVGNQAGNGFIVNCTASDSTTGLSGIAAVKCSVRVGASSYVSMLQPTDGSWGSIVENAYGGLSTAGWPAGTYTVWLRAQDNSASKSPNNWGVWSSSTITVLTGISTPGAVNLSYFNHLVSAQGVTLKWATQSEMNSKIWEIGRSTSAMGPFTTVAQKAAQGTTNQPTEYSHFDGSVAPQQIYYYQLTEVSTSDERITYGPIEVRTLGPASFDLAAAMPNPFSGQAQIRYQLPVASKVSLKVYNITGQLVRTLVDEVKAPGFYSATWNGRSDNGQALSNGIYFYSLEAGNYKSTKKITLIK